MKIEFWCIGKTNEPYLTEGIEKYLKRMGKYIPLEFKPKKVIRINF